MSNISVQEFRKSVGKGLRNFYIMIEDEIIDEDQVAYITSGAEWGTMDLTVNGELWNEGFVRVLGKLRVNKRIKTKGKIKIGW